MKHVRSQNGFTLIELLMVISIIGLLASVTFGYLGSARDKGRIAAGQTFSASLHNALGDHMVGEWTFDADSFIDTSGNGNNGTPLGGLGAADFVDSVMDRGIDLDGVAENVRIEESSSLDISGVITMSVWFKSNGVWGSEWPRIISKKNEVDWHLNPYEVVALPGDSGIVEFILVDTATNRNYCTGRQNVLDGKWHHIATVWDGSWMKIYVDGVLDNEYGCAFSGPITTVSSDRLWIGSSAFWDYVGGTIDDVRIYSKSLTAFEIRKQYAEGKGEHDELAVR